jgi:simple sugar transport system ATP-binding protein
MPDTTPAAAAADGEKHVALEVRDIVKTYGPVHALAGASLTVHAGEVVGLLGDNGAGKSTLVKCISGVTTPDSGTILLDGEPVHVPTPQTARKLGIETVYQGLALVPELDVAANLFLNREEVWGGPILGRLGLLRRKRMHEQAQDVLVRIGARVKSSRQRVMDLSGGQRQAVAIGRTVAWGRRVVLMDEPAAALGVEQARQVLLLARRLADSGVAVVLISHNMQHVVDACDRAVVLRQGRVVGDVVVADVTTQDLVHLITVGTLRPSGASAPLA